ncbi:MAG: GTPase ObgE [Candidatus Omnitrophica bacterium]|nr:GTPase ObgE [Candidatus Omnitrophota bacterium]
MFVDTAKIAVCAGRGGKGCESFERNRFKIYAIPSGGDGGGGGDVILEADQNIVTLLDFYYRRHFRSEKGGPGGSNRKKGKRGKDLLLRVPPGTVVHEALTGLRLRDLKSVGERVIVAKGGAGGKGNADREKATEGIPGEERELLLELRLIADCGIVGFPNVGKSTLLSKLTSAHPKIASYPFTTTSPLLGVLTQKNSKRSVVMADIPGLIEGAHTGKGLGDQFLKHIERTSFLLHLMDMSGSEGRNPVHDYETIRHELASYGKGLLQKSELLVANKMDLPSSKENLSRFQKKLKREILPISALTGEGLEKLVKALFKVFTSHHEKESIRKD